MIKLNSMSVRPKKQLGQHFLNNEEIALRIVQAIQTTDQPILEIGPGMGVLTKHLIKHDHFSVVEIDTESVIYLQKKYPELKIIEGDFLKLPLEEIYSTPFTIIGNFPYNISSQILFKILDHRDLCTEVVGMFQKEVAERVATPPGKKSYGILSVLLQAYYDIEYLFTVDENQFNPPPKVKSAVIRITRNPNKKLNCNEQQFKTIVKTAFNQRRKTLRNSLKNIPIDPTFKDNPILNLRPEQLSVQQFELITLHVNL